MGRRGGGGGRRGGGGGERAEDQYGETMVGQDKGDHYGFSARGGGGGTKGGDAGSRNKPGENVEFIRHVPKFLQAHAHMLGKPVEEEPEAAALAAKFGDWGGGREEEHEDDDDEQEALRRAIEQDPSLLAQHPELQSVADQAEAERVKARGNAAFTAGRLEEAVELFSRCIQLDPSNHIYYSNRAAAHTGRGDFAAAARDAARCTELRPGWAKGWSRLGAAHFGLEQFSEAREAYERAVRLEPNDAQLAVSLQKASAREAKQIAEGKHTFKRKLDGGGDGGGKSEQQKRQQTVRPSAGKKEKTLLSFGDGEEEEA